MLGSGNLGLVYLMEANRRLTLEEIEERHPALLPRCASTRTSAGCSCARPSTDRWCSGRRATHRLEHGSVDGEDPLAHFSPNAPAHLTRTDGFAHVADILVGSFYDPDLDEGCAFEELISFHGGLGGHRRGRSCSPRRRSSCRTSRIVGAAAVHVAACAGAPETAGALRGAGAGPTPAAPRP